MVTAPPELPEGTVTVLFTDMVDSTRLNQRLGDDVASALRREVADLCRRALATHRGVEIKNTGDGLMIAFQSARRAVACAREIQRGVAAWNQEHPDRPIQLRIGLHTGEVIHDEADLFGETVIIASRLEAAAPPGTILASSNVHALLGTARDELIHRGEIALKGIDQPWQAYEVPWEGSGAAAAAPVQAAPTSFIGREHELEEALQLLTRPDCRLLTLIGPGGMGKTRLAGEIAARAAPRFPDGATFVELRSVGDAGGIVFAIAAALGLRLSGSDAPRDELARFLADGDRLLVLDNFEQVTDGAPVLADLLAAAPNLRLVVTSREVLNLREEWLYHLAGMPVPSDAELDDAAQFGAVQLFDDRARQVNPAFDLRSELADVVRICRLVEGLPLAVEIAAAWTKYLTAAEIAAEIGASLDFLATNLRNVPEAHRQMRAVFEQSWQRLDEEEQRTFARVSVFTGGFTRQAAAEVADARLPVLASLVDKSLLRQSGGGRFDLHELLRQFGRAQLAELGEVAALRDAHGAHFMRFARDLAPEMASGDQLDATARFEAEVPNLLNAGEWLITHDRWDLLRPVTEVYHRFYQHRSRYVQGESVFAGALELIESRPPSPERDALIADVLVADAWMKIRLGKMAEAKAEIDRCLAMYREREIQLQPGLGTDPHTACGVEAMVRGDFEMAERCGNNALRAAEASGDIHNRAIALWMLAGSTSARGDYEAAWRYGEEAYETTHAAGDRWFEAYTRNQLGLIAKARGRYEQAAAHFDASYHLRRQFDDAEGMAIALGYLAETAEERGDHKEAEQYYRRSLALYRDIGDRGGRARTLCGLGRTACARGDTDAAGDFFARSLTIATEMNFVPLLFDILRGVGELLLTCGERDAGVEVLTFISEHPQAEAPTRAAVDSVLDQQGLPAKTITAARHRAHEHQLPQMVTAVRSAMQRAATSHGGTVAPGDAGPAPATGGMPGGDALTDREVAVLERIAGGQTNRQIADAMGISVGTTKWYTSQIYSKLGVQNRTEAVARGRSLGLLA